MLCNTKGIIGINLENTTIQCVTSGGKIIDKKNMYCDVVCKQFIAYIKNKYKSKIVLLKKDKTVSSIDDFLNAYLKEVSQNKIINENQIKNYAKGEILTEYYIKNLKVFDDGLKEKNK